jgi:NAD(P)-dependent dehydrogenase (short-subunit alcohol dehydrogenase family)
MAASTLDAAALADNFSVNVVGYFPALAKRTPHVDRHGAWRRHVNISSRAASMGMPGEYVHTPLPRSHRHDDAGTGARGRGRSHPRQRRQPRPDRHRYADPERFARLSPTVPMGRAAPRSREAVLWLLSPRRPVTGANIAVTGGR